MSTKVTLNSREIQTYLDGEHGVRELLEERAQRVLEAAVASAPVKTGAYKDGLGIAEGHTDRLQVRVGSSAPHSHFVEAKHGTMARALDAAGGA